MASKLISVAPFELDAPLRYDRYVFPRVTPDKKFSFEEARPASCERDMGEMANPRREHHMVVVSALESAMEALRYGENHKKGIFVVSTDEPDSDRIREKAKDYPIYFGVTEPTDEMIKKAHETLRGWCSKQVEDGDKIWARTKNSKEVSDVHRSACSYLKLERDWNYDFADSINCDSCGKMISPTAVKCPYCPRIFDLEKAALMGIVQPDQYKFLKGLQGKVGATEDAGPAPVKRGPGRPRKIVSEPVSIGE